MADQDGELEQGYKTGQFSFDQDPLSRLPSEDIYKDLRRVSDKISGVTPDQKNVVLHLTRAVLEATVDPLDSSNVSVLFRDKDKPGRGERLQSSFEDGVVRGATPGAIGVEAILGTIKMTPRIGNDDIDSAAIRWVGIAAGEFSTGGPIGSMRILEEVVNSYYKGETPKWMRGIIERESEIADCAIKQPAGQLNSKIENGDGNRDWFRPENPKSVQVMAAGLLKGKQ
jgi:hypothetical protein